MTATTGTVGVAISPVPAVTCNGSTVTAGLAWTPANYTPTAAGNVSVSVSASSGVCSGRVAQCGSVTVSAPTLACAMTATTGTVGTAISPVPAVTCNGSTVTAGLTWTPASLTPTAAGSVSVSVSASSGVCSGRVAQCGSVTVSPTLACAMTATTGTVGTAISPVPTVTCNGSTVTTGLAWTPANLAPTAAGSVSVSVSASSGVCSGRVAQCGSVTVSPTLACAMTATTGTVGVAISPVPAVTCNGSTVVAVLAWTPANLTPATAGSVSVSVSASSGVCSGRVAQCGIIAVSTPIVACTVSAVSNGSMTCGGQTYKTVVIGTQTWMAENLNYAVESSKCYGNCDKYGSSYNWATAMNLPSSCNSSTCSGYIQSKHQGICPSGWHIPSDAEWITLMDYGGSSTAGTKLKAASGWDNNGNGTDEYGFSALPGGYGYSDGSFNNVGSFGLWWSATESYASSAYYRSMHYDYSDVARSSIGKSYLLSIRCLQD